ncbi:release factor H-coupled RctB family protein [Actinoplanes lutulentus]|uniref:tRNA-splicing ligase RtcB n=1 Tax=Actinoplanes lutulentus TaxID=1287878 RepID=A0A327ZFM7_9ACTN|nr:RtcB family protein [Actinoplanes lutulentus]MBB2946795.1 release factor H-coupled RctB family protein [Actinoplanes lutulentus]RAK35687.1 RNA-splicing ligase RtcB [Actinoplanes lutulentus]
MSVKVFAGPSSWIESAAITQCHQVAALDGMIHVAGMPDLHPGKGAPIGAAMLSSVLYPFLVGSDIGCGIAVFPFRLKKVVPERLAKRFPDLDEPVPPPGDVPGGYGEGLGTVGRGNHFVELARVDEVFPPPRALPPAPPTAPPLPPAQTSPQTSLQTSPQTSLQTSAQTSLQASPSPSPSLSQTSPLASRSPLASPSASASASPALAAGDHVLIVHSGSRGFGERILRAHTEVHGAGPATDPAAYLEAHDSAVLWGSLNRRTLAERVGSALGADVGEPILDVCHNAVEIRDGLYLHRKGAAPGDGQDVLIAGTRGTRSYLVSAHAGPDAGFSVAHGAGRKMSRSDALKRGKAKHTVEELRRTPVGSLVVCGDRQLLFEEAPTAYKRIEQVIADLTVFSLATPRLTTVPVITYKTADKHMSPPASRTARRR